jgi:CheY-like chemotaxis protein
MEGLAAGGLRVLVMDDEEPIREVIRQILSDGGDGQVEFAGNGSELLAMYGRARDEGRPYNVVLMDLAVPGGMGGRETIGPLLDLDAEARAVLFTGFSNDPMVVEFERHGFSGLIPKPFDIEYFVEVLKSVARRGKALD